MRDEWVRALRHALWPVGPAAAMVATAGSLIAVDVAADFSDWFESRWGSAEERNAWAPEVRNYTAFVSETYKHLTIVTGIRYPEPGAPPLFQYCYAIRPQAGTQLELRLDLAYADGNGTVAHLPVADTDAATFGLPADELEAAGQAFCHFIGGDADAPSGTGVGSHA